MEQQPADKVGRLVIGMQKGDSVQIGDNMIIDWEKYSSNQIKLRITAPTGVNIKHIKAGRSAEGNKV